MKDERAGQATFLPLDSITVKPVNEKYRTFSKGALEWKKGYMEKDMARSDAQYKLYDVNYFL